jgi:[ribosomal protein S5]-alanine N-acetyltransferase
MKSDRLELKKLRISDAEFILTLLNTDSWIKFIGERDVKSKEDAIAYIKKINSNPLTTYWVIKIKDGLKSIGIITLIQRAYLFHKDLGFALLPAYTGQNYAFEASQLFLQNIMSNSDDTTIQAVTLSNNDLSIKLLNRLGFEFENEIIFQKEILQIFTLVLSTKTS